MISQYKNIILILVLVTIGIFIWYFESIKVSLDSINIEGEIEITERNARIDEKEKKYSRAREINLPAGYINIDNGEITVQEFIGKKVIMIDFWTYSCINCQRTTPYLNSWYEKYEDQGLVILGIHTPEFEFEKEYDNVTAAVKQADIKYPVVLDNDYGTWSAYKNRYWPRKYLIDIDGFIV